jgi:hypothetical protein
VLAQQRQVKKYHPAPDHPWRQPRSPFSLYAFRINTGHFYFALTVCNSLHF